MNTLPLDEIQLLIKIYRGKNYATTGPIANEYSQSKICSINNLSVLGLIHAREIGVWGCTPAGAEIITRIQQATAIGGTTS